MDEQQAIEQVRLRNQDAYRHLVERYHAGLIIYCDQLLHSRDDAEDIAQEALYQAYVKFCEFDEKKGRFSTWLYKIAFNKAIDHLRKQKRSVDVDEASLFAGFDDEPLLFDERQRLHDAVKALMPPEYCRVIEAYYWEGKSYEEIAQLMNVPRNTVGTWMRRAKDQLKEVLA